MSNLALDNVRPSSGGTYRDLPRGVAAAWCEADQTSASITASENVSSLTDNSAGNLSHNLTNAMSSAAFAVSTGQKQYDGKRTIDSASIITTYTYTSAVSLVDDASVGFAAFGDLA